MGVVTVKLPDVGEGIAEAELVEWSVKLGDPVREDQILASVMTDKATVEIPSPVEGKVIWLGGEIGQQLAIGSNLIKIEVEGAGEASDGPTQSRIDVDAGDDALPEIQADPPAPLTAPPKEVSAAPAIPVRSPAPARPTAQPEGPIRPAGEKPLASPSVRQRAMSAGIDLRRVAGTGPAGRITHDDVDHFLAGSHASPPRQADEVRENKVIGLRRKIAERMSNAKRRIPHITIVEEIDVTALEALREQLNSERSAGRPKLTVLPFLMAAMVRAIQEHPGLNAHFDDENDVIREFSAVHIGIATQTKGGLMVPVVRHSEHLSLWESASELARLAEASRNGTASRDELSGSTITISSLGPLGAIATTPIINHPEVAIVGVNRMEVRPKWDGSEFVPRKMMNLSSSFDHRVIDGWDAAVFVKRLKTLLETPALIFVEK
jgi:2-oxoisovalerate dehydrogenase E2 component (dihydrolipoyl transacylase)